MVTTCNPVIQALYVMFANGRVEHDTLRQDMIWHHEEVVIASLSDSFNQSADGSPF
jgi:hypothetical protein